MCPSVSLSNYTENKFYTFFLTQAGEFHKIFLDLSLGWKGDFCLSWSILKEASLVSLHPTPPFLWGTLTKPFSDSWSCPFKAFEILRCWNAIFQGFSDLCSWEASPQGKIPKFLHLNQYSTSELGMEIITIPKSTIGTLLS